MPFKGCRHRPDDAAQLSGFAATWRAGVTDIAIACGGAGAHLTSLAQDLESGHSLEDALKYLDSQDAKVMTTLSRKMLGYALGRQVLPTDKRLLTAISEKMKAGEGNISGAVLAIMNSRQFLNRRVY